MTSDEQEVPNEGDTIIRRSVKVCAECAQHYSGDSMFCPFDGTRLEESTWVAPTDPTVDPMLSLTIDGRYHVERVLGEGGTGTVYEVTHTDLHRAFAMKVLRREVARDPALATRFIQEARATASLKHPHIVSITDFGRLPDKTPYFVMERLVGRTLADVVHKGGQLPMERAIQIVLQVADALGSAHEAGIVHRDLKPENIFLVGRIDGEQKNGDDVRVVDFGAAKIAGASRITKTGIVFGTPHYMSPEQASGQPVDHRADIYALGVMMYELFAGRLPFEADTLMGVLSKQMFVEPTPFAEAGDPEAGRLLGALEAVTMRTLAKKPEHRFQTMAALAAELERTVSIDSSGRVSLAAGWTASPRRRSVRPSMGELSRALEGPARAPVYPSEEVTLPATSLRTPLLVGGVFLLLGAAAALTFALRKPAESVAVDAAPSASVASAAPPLARSVVAATSASAPLAAAVAGRSVHITTTPEFAEVWREGKRAGTAPLDLPLDPGGKPFQCTLRAPGFSDSPLVVSADSPATIAVTLTPVHFVPAVGHTRKPASTASTRHTTPDGLVDPF